ncbi:hypothetical protein [Candidatus Nitrospira bockiana]
MSAEGEGKAKQAFWVVAASLLVLLVAYNLYSGRTIEEIGLGSFGSVKFGKSSGPPTPASSSDQDLSRAPVSSGSDQPAEPLVREAAAKRVDHDEMARRQAELEAKLRQMEAALNRAETKPDRPARNAEGEGAAVRPVAIAGTWHDPSGATWIIQQNGPSLTLEEINPLLGVTAVGRGTITGRRLELTYQSAMQTTGRASLTVSADGHHLSGSAQDLTTGVSFPLTFSR